jgi:hypothetical protein
MGVSQHHSRVFSGDNRIAMKTLVWESSHHHIIREDLFKKRFYKLCTIVGSHLKHAIQFLSMCFSLYKSFLGCIL